MVLEALGTYILSVVCMYTGLQVSFLPHSDLSINFEKIKYFLICQHKIDLHGHRVLWIVTNVNDYF